MSNCCAALMRAKPAQPTAPAKGRKKKQKNKSKSQRIHKRDQQAKVVQTVEEELARASLKTSPPSTTSTDSVIGHSADEWDPLKSSTSWPERKVEEDFDMTRVSFGSSPSTASDHNRAEDWGPLGTLKQKEGMTRSPTESFSSVASTDVEMNQSADSWDPLASLTTWPEPKPKNEYGSRQNGDPGVPGKHNEPKKGQKEKQRLETEPEEKKVQTVSLDSDALLRLYRLIEACTRQYTSDKYACIGFVYLLNLGQDVYNVGLILEPKERGWGYAFNAMEQLLKVAFDQLKCHRVQVRVPESPHRNDTLKLLTKL